MDKLANKTQLEEQFPRIADAIVLLWGNPEMDTYFNKITLDERGDREGFPSEVMSDLLMLATLHAHAYPFASSHMQYANGGMRFDRGIGFR